MARPSTVDSEAVVQAVREGVIAAEVARQHGITRMRVTQILRERAPDLLANKGLPAEDPSPEAQRRREKLRNLTLAVLNRSETKIAAARALGLTASGLNARLRRLKIDDPLSRAGRDERQRLQTIEALKTYKSKYAAATHLGLTLSGLASRMKRWGLEG